MKLSWDAKREIAINAAAAMIKEEREKEYEALRKELTRIADLQFSNVPITGMKKYAEYIEFSDTMKSGKGYPDDFKAEERKRDYRNLGFVPSGEIPLLKKFPCKTDGFYNIRVCDDYADAYTKAVRKYIFLYFEAVKNYNIIFESLKLISTDKELSYAFPELLPFCTARKKEDKQPVPVEKFTRCKELLKKYPHLSGNNNETVA
jgi:hypothetical protein